MGEYEPIPFIYRGPVESEKELARYRDTLLRFIEGTIPVKMREEGLITLSLQHVIRFMLAGQELDKQRRELEAGMHAAQEELAERVVGAEVLLRRVAAGRVKSGEVEEYLAQLKDRINLGKKEGN